MKKFAALMGIAVLSLSVLAGCGSDKPAASSNNTSSGSSNAQQVEVTLSNWKIDLSKTELKAGQPVKLHVTTKEGLHGLAIKDTSVKVDSLAQGSDKSVDWTPDKPGTYEVYCTVVCGGPDQHGSMKTTITVK